MTTAKRSRDYDRYRESQAKIAADRSAAGREIGGIPEIGNVRRRARCRKSLRLFCETYNPRAFTMGWSADHLRAIARIEEAATLGALFALALPRGSGKTTICRMAALWAISYAHRRYVFVIGANDTKAGDTLDSLRTMIRFSPEYGEDFPEIAYPVRALQGIAQRAGGQTCGGEPTMMEWASGRCILPTVPPPANWPKAWPLREDGRAPTSGAAISASGLTGDGIRGSLLTLTTGEQLRPDLVLLDDPQTNESARSLTQNVTRERLVGADVLGMAGPGKSIAAVMPCTVIEPGDFVDQILDRGKHPLWRGERSGILKSMPANLDKWADYFDVYRTCAQLEPPDYTAANDHYTANRDTLDAGAVAAWEERHLPGEVSAVQHAMNLYCRDRRAFFAEYMNTPLGDESAELSKEIAAAGVAGRVNRVGRGWTPRECTRLTAFIDCGADVLWWAVCGWDETFGGGVVDYGTWPRQDRSYFAARDVRPSLADVYPGLDEDQRLYAALRDCSAAVLGKRYPREETIEPMSVERCFVDEGWKDSVVYQFCRESPYAAVLLPSKGHSPKSSTAMPMGMWRRVEGDRLGHNWRVRPVGTGKGRHCIFDADAWKSILAERLLVPPGGKGCLKLFGDDPAAHRLFADHLAAEYATRVTAGGRTFDKWEARPNRDNHWLDCLVGCAVAASERGLTLPVSGEVAERPRPAAPARKLSDIQREKLAKMGS